ncbi:MAG: hypothetical protein KGZ82_13695 [Bacteroidales bacterium]|nr:hypothetical protein [Bacteroidales bacterium]
MVSKQWIVILLLSSFCAISPIKTPGQVYYRFEKINKENGLSQGTVNAIFEDNDGLMWFGTNDGLNRYDGNKITVFRRDHNDSLSLPNNNILSITQDNQNRLWIGTMGSGLCYLDLVNNTFHSFESAVSNTQNQFIGQNAYCLYFDSARNILWAGTNTGVIKLDFKQQSLKYYDFLANLIDNERVGNIYSLLAEENYTWIGTEKGGLLQMRLSDEKIISIPIADKVNYVDDIGTKGIILNIIREKGGKLWVATLGNFILYLDHESMSLKKHRLQGKFADEYYNPFTRSIALVGDTAFWCASSGGGLQIVSKKNGLVKNIMFNANKPDGISSNTLNTVYPDKNGGVWIGDNGLGINYFYPDGKIIKHLSPSLTGATGLTFKSVRSIYVDDENVLWVGGYGGLNAFDSDYKRIKVISDIDNAYIIHPDPIEKNIFWIGTEGGRVRKVSKITGETMLNYGFINTREINGIIGNSVYSMQDKNNDELFIGTEKGLNIFNKHTGKCTYAFPDINNKFTVPVGRMRAIFTDSKDRTWVGTMGGGLAYMNDNTLIFNNFRHKPDDPTSLSSNIIYCVIESKNGIIYIGTDNGLNIFNERQHSFTHVSTADGLINDVIYGILEDDAGNLWLSTNEGISCYNPLIGRSRNYDQDDGLQANEFNSGAFLKTPDGTMYFGGINGVSIFQPNELVDNPIIPRVVFTAIKIGSEQARLNKPITQAEEITIDYFDQSFQLDFAALNYYKPFKNQYAYRIRELSDRWIQLGNQNRVDVIHLGYGTFHIEVIASNNDGVWNYEGRTLKVIIPPPYWATNWFRLLCGIVIITLFLLIYQSRIRSVERKKQLLEHEIQLRTADLKTANEDLLKEIETRLKAESELQAANQTKDKFFSIIAHDLKNPFSVILGLTELINDGFEQFDQQEIKEFIHTINKSTEDLYNLLENLLGWSVAQRSQLKLAPQILNVKALVDENVQLHNNQASQKKITLSVAVDSRIEVWADNNTMNTVFRNLISNAIKFTSTGGLVTVSAEEKENEVTIFVKDTGMGIAKENLARLFRVDEKFKMAGTANEKGTGLGLVLCLEFIRANNGSIQVNSTPGEGSTFWISLPKKIST